MSAEHMMTHQVWEWDKLNGGKVGSSGLCKKRQSETLVNIVRKVLR